MMEYGQRCWTGDFAAGGPQFPVRQGQGRLGQVAGPASPLPMSYLNYIDHPTYGKKWFEAKLRNWLVLGYTSDQNRAKGHLIVCHLLDHPGICSSGKSVKEVEKRLLDILDIYAEKSQPLPTTVISRWTQLRMWYHLRFGKLRGISQAVVRD